MHTWQRGRRSREAWQQCGGEDLKLGRTGGHGKNQRRRLDFPFDLFLSGLLFLSIGSIWFRSGLHRSREERRQKSGQSKEDIQKLMDEVRSIKEIMKDAKQCPRCKMAISKIEGCNKMTCWNCGRFFCYQCNAAISGYDHFKGDCVVFDQVEIDRWEMQVNQRQQRQVVAQVQADLFEGEYGYPCPTCRSAVPKIGNNNHLYCWSCNQHFCALCRKSVQKMSQHFGPKGCKQHTADP